MDKAAPQAATGASDKDASALEVLRVPWGPEYSVGYDDEHGWWATRAGVIGHIITAADPEELGRKLGDDCGAAR